MNLFNLIKYFLTFNKLHPIEKKIFFLNYSNNKYINNDTEAVFSVIQKNTFDKKKVSTVHEDKRKEDLYKEFTKDAIYFYNLFSMFDPEDPVHFYMLVW